MENQILFGTLLTIIAGVMQESFTLPMKFMRRWGWENSWLVYATVGLLILTVLIAVCTIPDLLEVYRRPDMQAITLAVLFGAGGE